MNKLNLIAAQRIKLSVGEINRLKMAGGITWTKPLDESTQAVVDYATTQGYTLPANLTALDNLIKSMKSAGIWQKLDLFYVFAGDGSTGFKLINIIDPSSYYETAYGGLTWSTTGIKGNGTNAYVNTNFNPALLESGGQKYQLNNASRLAIVFDINGVANYNNSAIDSSDGTPVMNSLLNSEESGNRINNGNNSSSIRPNLSGTGLRIISRDNSNNFKIYKKDIIISVEVASVEINNANQHLLRAYNFWSKVGISCYGMGASIPFQVSQDFRTVFNTYLSAIGQNPIA